MRADHVLVSEISIVSYVFFNDTATTEIYTLSLHDALPISPALGRRAGVDQVRRRLRLEQVELAVEQRPTRELPRLRRDRKSTRLNSSHSQISYAVFCLQKKKTNQQSFIRRPACSLYLYHYT